MYVLPIITELGAISRTQTLESKVLLRPSGLNTGRNPLRPLYELLRFLWASVDTYYSFSHLRQASGVTSLAYYKSHLLI